MRRVQPWAVKGGALAFVATMSAVWTANIVSVDLEQRGAAGEVAMASQDVTPAEPVSAATPAGRTRAAFARIKGTTPDEIPAVALAAYQRATQVMEAADPTCRLDWELLAAIGRVESDHGRTSGGDLDSDGVARPGIFGPVLDGHAKVQRITDTDGGDYDKTSRYDRAVGPMQFLPGTWSAAKVDADGDGWRNPQDIDDAALAAGVYLCSGAEDLATRRGRAAAVFRYNHSRQYVNLVERIRQDYLAGLPATASAAFAAVAHHASAATPVPPHGPASYTPSIQPPQGGSPQPLQPHSPPAVPPTSSGPSPAPPTPGSAPNPEPEVQTLVSGLIENTAALAQSLATPR